MSDAAQPETRAPQRYYDRVLEAAERVIEEAKGLPHPLHPAVDFEYEVIRLKDAVDALRKAAS